MHNYDGAIDNNACTNSPLGSKANDIERECDVICGLLVGEIKNASRWQDIKNAADAIGKARLVALSISKGLRVESSLGGAASVRAAQSMQHHGTKE